MPRAPTPPRRSADKREAILEGATRIFLRDGYGGTSMDAVAAEAGVSKRTVYAHFGSKEELFGAIVTRQCEQSSLWPALGEGLTTPLPEPFLRRVATEMLQLVTLPEPLAVYRAVLAEIGRFPELGQVLYENGPGRGTRELTAYLRRATKAGLLAVDDPELASWMFFEMARAPFHERLLLGIGPAPSTLRKRRAVDQAVETFLARFAPR